MASTTDKKKKAEPEDREATAEEIARDGYISDLLFIQNHINGLATRCTSFNHQFVYATALDLIEVLLNAAPTEAVTLENSQRLINALSAGGVEGVLPVVRELVYVRIVRPIVLNQIPVGLGTSAPSHYELVDKIHCAIAMRFCQNWNPSAAHAFAKEMCDRYLTDELRGALPGFVGSVIEKETLERKLERSLLK